jgi:type IV secretory pathway TrbD component
MITSLACSICGYHSVENTSNAAGYSIFFLLIVILMVLGTVIFFLARMMRREAANLDPELTDNYVRPSSTNR